MELARQNRRRLEVPRIAVHLQLPPYLWLILSLLLGIMVIVSGTLALTRLMPPLPNPFAAYDDLISCNVQDPAFDLACARSPIRLRTMTCSPVKTAALWMNTDFPANPQTNRVNFVLTSRQPAFFLTLGSAFITTASPA